jgi:hypothetical protein
MIPGAALLVALLVQTASGTAADAASTRVRLELRAPHDCTSRLDLAARIATRSSRIEVVDDAPISAHVDVAPARTGGVVADLVLTSAGVEQPPRRVVARSCAEAADGVALIIAVTLDPNLRRKAAAGPSEQGKASGGGTAGAPPAAERTAPSASSGERVAPPAVTPPDSRIAPAAATRPPAPLEAKAEAPVASAPGRGQRRELGASAAAQAIFGPAPVVMPGIAVYLLAALDREGPWSPALVVGATHVWRSDLPESGGAASFTLDAASLDACPLRLRWSRLVARPCASALFGRLGTQGSNTVQAAGAARPFGAAGAVISAGFGSPIELTARLGIGVTLLRDSYEFATNVFFRAEAVTISASVGVGVHWP